ncbi:MAG: hypothetical protein QXE47_02700 [Candidatus Anstonellales archaeon]
MIKQKFIKIKQGIIVKNYILGIPYDERKVYVLNDANLDRD